MKKTPDIAREFIQENPEFAGKQELIEKLVSHMGALNPDIAPSPNFKARLSERIDGVVALKMGKTSTVWYKSFLIPVFSFAFIFVGMYYYFDGTEFFHQNQNDTRFIQQDVIDATNIEISQDDFIAPESVQADIPVEVTQIQKTTITPILEKTLIPVVEPAALETLDTPVVKAKKIIIKKAVQEDTIIDDMFGKVSKDEPIPVGDHSARSVSAGELDDYNHDELDLLGDLLGGWDDGSEYELSFKEFCEAEKGEFMFDEEDSKCIREEKQCMESSYVNGTCDFVEKK